MPSPTPGQMNCQITIQKKITSKDAEGGMVDVWVDVVCDLWAKVNNFSGNERRATQQGGQIAEERTEFTIYFIPGIDASMRIVYADKYYNIRHVNNFMEKNKFIVLTTDTGGNHGR